MWEQEAKIEYITTKTTYAELAKKHGVSLSAIATIAKKEKWRAERKKQNNAIVKRALQKREKEEAKKLEKLKIIEEKLEDKVLRRLEDNNLTAKDLQLLARALTDAVAARRNLFEIPGEAEAERRKHARRRMQIEERKMQIEEEKVKSVEEGMSITVNLGDSEKYAN